VTTETKSHFHGSRVALRPWGIRNGGINEEGGESLLEVVLKTNHQASPFEGKDRLTEIAEKRAEIEGLLPFVSSIG